MAIDNKLVMELRNRTSAGIVDCKNALEEAGGDMDKAIEVLKKKGAIKAAKKASERDATEGLLATYLHHNGKLASIVELTCETDFVARGDDFKNLANDLALQVAAVEPTYVSPEAIPADVLEAKKAEFAAEMADDKKPEDIKAKIIEGKLTKWYSDVCLTKQSFIKDEDMTIEQLITALSAKSGEKIEVTRFSRMVMSAPSGQTC
ncbi:MAG: elongation factor Ts [Candidatus Magasanikbacteria bacterium]|nr:elongation factor Ts [Candidatus Magasanikbacteria bacterium]MCA9389763.1 elongation factor Ts [Candidatus Magasanikbacteria bacterium]MCA9391214.1 elongation factor Ts [Candidatus Magasanikbacteria bacterium]USN52151.1 MAG: elongation factor Ts [Candidatus Nomurabacteria bacterium]HPF94962.1 elongation factor Ts [bacterium]